MGQIPPELIEKIRQTVDITDIIGSYVPLKKAGTSFKALSPFNKEKTPSFYVLPQRQLFKCWSSGHGGDVFKFLMLYENIDFPTAVRRVAEKAGIEIPEDDGPGGERGPSRQLKDQLLQLHHDAAQWWCSLLAEDPRAGAAREYLKGRKIPDDWVKEFTLGYAPDGWDATLKWAAARGYTADQMVEAGLAVRNEKGRVYDRFRDRLVFPIANETGQIIAFSARILGPGEPKYINSPETILYKKSRTLFGFDRARRPILEKGSVIVCEGQIDVLRCHAAGFTNVVAPLGTAFTPEHCRTLKRFTDRIILCLDADRAGQRAAERVGTVVLGGDQDNMEALVQADLGIEVAALPAGADPDSLITEKGPSAFEEVLSRRVSFLDFFIDAQSRKHDTKTPVGRRRMVEEVAGLLAMIPNAVVRERLEVQAAVRMEVSPTVLAEEVKAKARKPAPAGERHGEENGEGPELVEDLRVHPSLKDLILLMLSEGRLVPEVQRRLDPAWLEDLPGATLVFNLMEAYNNDEWSESGVTMGVLTPAEQNYVAGLDVESLHKVSMEDRVNAVDKLVRGLELDHLNRRIQTLTAQLKEGQGDKAGLMSELSACIKRKSGLTKP
jgi:DNA primase